MRLHHLYALLAVVVVLLLLLAEVGTPAGCRDPRGSLDAELCRELTR